MNRVPTLTYYDLGSQATAFSTTRHGGWSSGNYGELNINPYCGDAAENVARNREALATELGIDEQHIVLPHQVHGVEVRQIGNDFFALPENIRTMILEGVDAVMTDCEGICIGVSTADCIPVLLFDEQRRAVCAVHAGWRGTVASITVRAVDAMRVHFRTDPSTLKAVVGPGISVDAFEVGDEVYEQFAAAGFDMESIAHRKDKWHIDLVEANRLQLLNAGLPDDNIKVCGICTYNNVDDYFSARRLGAQSGRIYTGIFLKPNN